jgi:hypothetical protein
MIWPHMRRSASRASSLVVLIAVLAPALGTRQSGPLVSAFVTHVPSAFREAHSRKGMSGPRGRMGICAEGGASIRGGAGGHARGGISAASCCDRRMPPEGNSAETTILRSLSPGGSLRKGLSLPHVLATAAGGISLSSKIEEQIARGDFSVSARPMI